MILGFPNPTDILAIMNLTSIACSAPVRNKTKLYRNVRIVFYSLSVLSVALRFIARFIRGTLIWYDDWTIVLILVCTFLLPKACITNSSVDSEHYKRSRQSCWTW